MEQEIQWILQEKYGGRECPEFFADVERLKEGEHVDYIIGFASFLDCRINLGSHPLIPRPETEHWTERVISNLLSFDSISDVKECHSSESSRSSASMVPRANEVSREGGGTRAQTPKSRWDFEGRLPRVAFQTSECQLRVLDIFAGSGCIGIAILAHVPFATVDFAEKEERHLKQIEENAKENGIDPARFCVTQSDVFSNISERYNLIVANPPYIAKSRREGVQQSVLLQEPHEALFAKEDGLAFIRLLIKNAPNYLEVGGSLVFEFDDWQKPIIEELLSHSQFSLWQTHKDQYGAWRWCSAHLC
ncbi:MAG: methyltransferase [bacterium]|nr:methyltransferase [bacterium]